MTNFSPLLSYINFVLSNNILNLKPPAKGIYDCASVVEGKTMGVVIDRQGQFQTELFIVGPQTSEIVMHIHPGIDSYEMHLSGDFKFIVQGETYNNNSDGRSLKDRFTLEKVDSDFVHGGLFKEGGAFLSFQHWYNGKTPTSVSDIFEERKCQN